MAMCILKGRKEMQYLKWAKLLGAVVAFILLPFDAFAQSSSSPVPASPTQPSVPHERMSFFEGTWSMQPNPYFKGQPAGTQTGTHEETCAWMPGGHRHMVCRSWRERNGVRSHAMYILSYSAEDNFYIVHHAFADGANLTYHGRFDGERWIMDMVFAPNLPPNRRFRTIITKVPDGVRYVEESSLDGGPWEITEDYRFKRVK
jgi:hypothetical protein